MDAFLSAIGLVLIIILAPWWLTAIMFISELPYRFKRKR